MKVPFPMRHGCVVTALVCSMMLAAAGCTAPVITAAEPGSTDKDAPKKFTTTASGLQYRILRKSKGKKPTAADTVTVHYRGWLDNKKEFDSSYKRDKPSTFPLDGVIKGWTEGLQLVGVGGMIELKIPAKLGYGDRDIGDGLIPPSSTLHFLIELRAIK